MRCGWCSAHTAALQGCGGPTHHENCWCFTASSWNEIGDLPYSSGTMRDVAPETVSSETQFVRGLGLLDSTMIVAGSMIGSGIFIVSADMARQLGSSGWLLAVWLLTGLLTL